MGQNEDLSSVDKKDGVSEPPIRRRRRKGKWDTSEETVSLTELKAKTSEEESKKRQKRLYVGNLPAGTKLQDVVEFFNGALMALIPASQVDPRDPPVTKTEIYNPDQGYCFLEFKTPELADMGFKLDGITCNGYSLKIRRPIDFTQNNQVEDTKIFVQNIPLEMSDDQMKELLEKHGKLKMTNLLRDPTTGVNKGYGFFEYEDSRSAKMAVLHLNGHVLGKNVLSVKHAAFGYFASGGKPIDCKASNLPNSVTQTIISNPLLGLQLQNGRQIGSKPSKVVQLLNMVFHEDLISDYNYNEVVRLVKDEGERYGKVEEVVIPRPEKDLTFKEGVGKVFLKYSTVLEARKAQYMFNGRIFDKNRVVCAAFFPEDKFNKGKYTLI